jgi:Fe2+ transport system protein FeoA
MTMDRLEPGQKALVSEIRIPDAGELYRLYTLGLEPGVEFTIHQKSPAFVLDIGETTLALGRETACKIGVVPLRK